jgi:hypothetical protein
MAEQHLPDAPIVLDLPDRSRIVALPSHGTWSNENGSLESNRHLRLASRLVQTLLQNGLPWILARDIAGRRETIALCTYGRGKLNGSLYVSLVDHIESADLLSRATEWMAARLRATNLLIESFASAPHESSLPAFAAEVERYTDVKLYVWDLSDDNWDRRMSSNHRRNISRAKKAGTAVAVLPPSAALAAHLDLTGSSLNRRAQRGESTALATGELEIRRMLAAGRAEQFQAVLDGQVLSSKIVYTIDRFAYYYSGGTSEAGMRLGASHFLMHAIASSLRTRGILSFNLDVANSGTGGLARYKADFGTEEWYVSRVRSRYRHLSRLAANAWHHAMNWRSGTRQNGAGPDRSVASRSRKP